MTTVTLQLMSGIAQVIEGCFSLLKGMWVTLRTMVRPVVTVQYPDEKLTLPDRWRGVLSLEVSKCISCGACVRVCPAKLIMLQSHMGDDRKRVLDSLRWLNDGCAHCDMCVNACPTHALAFHHGYELATFTRESLQVELAKAKTAEAEPAVTGLAEEEIGTLTPDGRSALAKDLKEGGESEQ
jgi:NADH-quinone oxidoreductase subunit I